MDEERQKKIFLMKIGIGFLMVLIFVFWVINLKNVWRNSPTSITSQTTSTSTEWAQIKNDLSKTMSELRVKFTKIEANQKMIEEIASSSLIQDLIKETEKLASSSLEIATSSLEIATSTVATSTLKNNNCPEYINCMPSIGEPRPCQIPLGCEGITQIAY